MYRARKTILLFILILIAGIFILYLLQKDQKEETYLRDRAKEHNLLIGTAVNEYSLVGDKKYAETLKKEFSIITPENEMKFNVVHPQRNLFDFTKSDTIVNFALKNNIKVRGHTLVWNKRIPSWLTEDNYSDKEIEEILKNHIYTVMEQYKGDIYAWDVVNEAFNNDGSLKDSIWLRTMGPDYIKKSFQWAKEADPDALLFYNDYSAEITNEKSDAIYEMIKKFKHEGIPIDGVGFQFHTSLYQNYNEEELQKNMKRFSKLNLKINVTELDVKISDMYKAREIKLQDQADKYSIILNSCLKLGKACTVFGMWGFTDKYTWLENDSPLIFDERYRKKPSYKKLIDILSE